ncbi:hypothetical protein LEP48_03445 [Isoptericola sp. NEAU-Y5]|uniref:ABC3 transporter permease C-terminal domain-containing protein n=1 Tax=Isoptericola luteus TaxID=2879484 RepID=A0ABS7ZD68_9MICO|nr:FtsX-like permease family protein [Isoptericola sp. NEAU-Y5]MCA5892407.1 hypothetical protein [Isoptericola sp. NEAU-Y5]
MRSLAVLLLRRHLRLARGATLVVALVSVLAAGVATTAARAIAGMQSSQVAHVAGQMTPQSRDLTAGSSLVPAQVVPVEDRSFLPPDVEPALPAEPGWEEYLDGMRRARDDQPAPLRDVLGEPDFVVWNEAAGVAAGPASEIEVPRAVLSFAPGLGDSVRLVEGTWPGPTPVAVRPGETVLDGPLQVVVTTAGADVLDWELGGVYAGSYDVEVVGIVEPVDAGADVWAHRPYAPEPVLAVDFDRGDVATVAVYGAPAMAEPMTTRRTRTTLWFDTDVGTVEPGAVATLAAQLRGFTSRPVQVVAGDGLTPLLRSDLEGVLSQVLAARAGTDAILAVLVSGPLGALAAVMVLAARLVVERRRSALGLLVARGATGIGVRSLMAAEGLVVSVPAAAAGLALGLVLLPGPVTTTQVLLAAAAGLAPGVAAALSTVPGSLRTERVDAGAPRRSRARLVVDLLAVGLAALTTALLLSRGAITGSPTGTTTGAAAVPLDEPAVDPLLAVAPLLVSLAGALVVVRLTPPFARAAERMLARRRDLVPFLGAARATRAPAGGVVPALALVLGVAVAASSSVVLATLDHGIETHAHRTLGADLRLTGPVMNDATVGELRQVDGVREVATVERLARAGELTRRLGMPGDDVAVLAADTAALARVQADVPGGQPGIARLGAAGQVAGEPLPVAVHAMGQAAAGAELVLEVPGADTPVRVVSVIGTVPGVASDLPFVLVDAAAVPDLLEQPVEPRTALVSLEPDADPAEVAADVANVVPGVQTQDRAATARAVLSTPSAAGLERAAVLATALAAVLCVVAVVLMLVLATPERSRLLGVLRSMGLRRSEARGIVAWEVVPWAVAALVGGVALGVAVPALVLATVDLGPLVGGGGTPPLVVDPLLVALGVGGLVLVLAVGVAVATVLGRRGSTASALRGTPE